MICMVIGTKKPDYMLICAFVYVYFSISVPGVKDVLSPEFFTQTSD
jgi:hypothetical protein